MAEMKLTSNVDQVAAAFSKMAEKQVPFATSLALNRVAREAKNQVRLELSRVFDRPTEYILNSLRVVNSTKTNLIARLEHRLEPGKADSSTVLRAEIEGGPRRMTSTEKLFGYFIIPSAFAPVDRYGNVAPSTLKRIVNAVSKSYAPQATKRKKQMGTKSDFVLDPIGRPLGIYQRRYDGSLIPILHFTKKAPRYKKRYDLEAAVAKVRDEKFGQYFNEAMDQALATAKITIK
jgi:hypothetical protein